MPIRSRKPHLRTIRRCHLLVRLELKSPHLTSAEIAKMVGLSPQSYVILKASQLYRDIYNQYLSGVLTKLDVQVDNNLELTAESLKFAVPIAMQALVEQAIQTKNERIRNKAANDILDRDGHFAKVQRIGVATTEQGGAGDDKDNAIAGELVRAMVRPKLSAPTIDSPPASDSTQ